MTVIQRRTIRTAESQNSCQRMQLWRGYSCLCCGSIATLTNTQRLTQALVNNEVTEVSNKTILQELQEAKTTISRLSAHHARSVGWDNRLTAAMKERDDMQQERDFESQRARLAESRFAALKEKTCACGLSLIALP